MARPAARSSSSYHSASVPAANRSTISPALAAPLSTAPARAGDVSRLGAPPVDARAGVGGLVGDEQLDRRPEDRVGEVAGRRERLELLAELGAEEVVDDRQHLGRER